MMRALVEVLGWFLVLCATAKLFGLVEFSLHLSTPTTCTQEAPVRPKTADHPLITQLKRDARKLSKAQPYTHSQALELLARQHGYQTYASMREALKPQEVTA